MNYQPDVLGPGFIATKLELEPDKFSPRSATLVSYRPESDPKAGLPDRVIPLNLVPGGDTNPGAFRVLPPQSSPQQEGEVPRYYRNIGTPLHLPQRESGPEYKTIYDREYLQDYLEAELRGREIQLGEELAKPVSPCFIAVYVHGWNDYFYQTHLARMMSHFGAAFYGLDLHRYGRNMPEWSGPLPYNCYEEDYSVYDSEIDWAIAVARQEHPGLPLVVMAHSNGGAVVSGWAARHHDGYDGLIFISPWVVQDVEGIPAGETVRDLMAHHLHGWKVPLVGAGSSVYQDSLAGYKTIGSPLPRRLVPFLNDPSVRGWIANPQWRILTGAPMLLGWLSEILTTQAWLKDSATFSNQPVLCLTGAHDPDPFYQPEIQRINQLMAQKWQAQGISPLHRTLSRHRDYTSITSTLIQENWKLPLQGISYKTSLDDWNESARHIDTVLNGDLIEARIKDLYGHVDGGLEVRQVSGVHDLTLSQPLERAEVFAMIGDWLHRSEILK